MRNLINFILKNGHWLFFLLLVFVSVFMLVRNNEFQRSKYLSVVQELTGQVYAVSSSVQSYMRLKDTNAELLQKIAQLETHVDSYKRQMEAMQDTTGTRFFQLDSVGFAVLNYIPARVVNNSVSGIENYITLNKGSDDFVKKDMGVITPNGIVGVVVNVSRHSSLVIPMLNPKFRLHCKVRGSGHFGPLVWDGKDPRYSYLEELPRHVTFNLGDTIVTSGYSSIFPEGIPVGAIVAAKKHKNDNFNALKIKLFTDFTTLNEALIVYNSYKEERKQLEKEVVNGNN